MFYVESGLPDTIRNSQMNNMFSAVQELTIYHGSYINTSNIWQSKKQPGNVRKKELISTKKASRKNLKLDIDNGSCLYSVLKYDL